MKQSTLSFITSRRIVLERLWEGRWGKWGLAFTRKSRTAFGNPAGSAEAS